LIVNSHLTQIWTIFVTSSCLLVLFIWRGQKEQPKNLSPHRLRRRFAVNYQSKGIPFPEWLAQFTLCFAPFAAHLLTGVPEYVVVSYQRPPSWTHINFFNPMTIVWRYVMIADRRLRRKNWAPEDMAASNAAFWTGSEWDGSEKIMLRSRAWMTACPPRHRISFLSVSMVGTIIIAMQGVQAIYQLCQIIWTKLSPIQALPDIFIPLAVGSLYRLPAAMWLTGDFGYDGWKREGTLLQSVSRPSSPRPDTLTVNENAWINTTLGYKPVTNRNDRRYSESSWPLPPHTIDTEVKSIDSAWRDISPENHMHPQTHWKSTLFRLSYILSLLAIVVVFGLGHLVAQKDTVTVASLILVHFLYISFCLVLLILSIYYFLSRKATSVLIPCFNSTWYTVFTIMWYLYCLVCIVINCIEMRRTSCGVYTTYPLSAGFDDRLCALYGVQ
jgi:hypothetical protein